jgi:hypothetical protein
VADDAATIAEVFIRLACIGVLDLKDGNACVHSSGGEALWLDKIGPFESTRLQSKGQEQNPILILKHFGL